MFSSPSIIFLFSIPSFLSFLLRLYLCFSSCLSSLLFLLLPFFCFSSFPSILFTFSSFSLIAPPQLRRPSSPTSAAPYPSTLPLPPFVSAATALYIYYYYLSFLPPSLATSIVLLFYVLTLSCPFLPSLLYLLSFLSFPPLSLLFLSFSPLFLATLCFPPLPFLLQPLCRSFSFL